MPSGVGRRTTQHAVRFEPPPWREKVSEAAGSAIGGFFVLRGPDQPRPWLWARRWTVEAVALLETRAWLAEPSGTPAYMAVPAAFLPGSGVGTWMATMMSLTRSAHIVHRSTVLTGKCV